MRQLARCSLPVSETFRAALQVGMAMVVSLSGCTTPNPMTDSPPAYENFTHCRGHSCDEKQNISLSSGTWSQVTVLFAPRPPDAEKERETASQAIALLERIVGSRTGTSGDRAGTFRHTLKAGQLDCQDEAHNTATYLQLLANEDLLRFHRPDGLAHRGLLVGGGWPHSTAVMTHNIESQRFAVDSWFLDNGAPPHVVPLEDWLAGWRPPPTMTDQH